VIISDPYTSYHLPVFNNIDIVSMTAHSTPPINLKERIRDNFRFFDPYISSNKKNDIIDKYNVNFAVINSSIFPWISLPANSLVFSSYIYPNWNENKNNAHVISFDGASTQNIKICSKPDFFNYFNQVSVFPKPDIANLTENKLRWEHAGAVFVRMSLNIKELSFNSEGGTNHIFYYIIHDSLGSIKEEEVFVNKFSSRKIYHINNCDKGNTIIFNGNGISPLSIEIKCKNQ